MAAALSSGAGIRAGIGIARNARAASVTPGAQLGWASCSTCRTATWVFTLPHEVNALAAVHLRWVYDTLMQCTAATLTGFAANPRWLGGVGAFTLVLHTWTQDLRRHLHVHALMACGALQCAGASDGDGDGDGAWIEPRRWRNFLFPVHALFKVFRAKFMHA